MIASAFDNRHSEDSRSTEHGRPAGDSDTSADSMTQIQNQQIYLASASPRRHELLNQMGIAHEILRVPSPPGEDEPQLPNEAPASYVRRTAREKAERAVAHLAASGLVIRPILTADTTVIMGSRILAKAHSEEDVCQALAAMSGRTHEVHTAIVVAWQGRLYEDVSITKVIMKSLTEAEIRWYAASGEGLGKAGAYGIQGLASAFIETISGSYSGVMGLPLFETCRLLARAYSASG